MSLVLHGNHSWTSPYVLSVFVALREKGLPFEVTDVDLNQGRQWDAAFTKPSLTSRVPMLVDGNLSLTESSAIVEYLEDAYAAPAYPRVLPAEVGPRARCRQLMAWIRSDLLALREQRSAEYVFYPHAQLAPFTPLSAEGQFAARKLLSVADAVVPSGGHLFGAWCVADTDLAMMLQRLCKTGFDVPARLRAFADREWERAAVREFVAHARPTFAPARMQP